MAKKPTHQPAIKFSSYNRQHALKTDKDGQNYDPLERDIAKYRALFREPITIDHELMNELPLSVGLLRSMLVVELGLEAAKSYFTNLHQKYDYDDITDIFDYIEAVRRMKTYLAEGQSSNDAFPGGGGPGNPPATARERHVMRGHSAAEQTRKDIFQGGAGGSGGGPGNPPAAGSAVYEMERRPEKRERNR